MGGHRVSFKKLSRHISINSLFLLKFRAMYQRALTLKIGIPNFSLKLFFNFKGV